MTAAVARPLAVGQCVTLDHPGLGVVEATITRIQPSTARPEQSIVFFLHGGAEYAVFSPRVTPLEVPMTTEPGTKKAPRKSRKATAAAPEVEVQASEIAAVQEKLAAPAGRPLYPFKVGDDVRAKLGRPDAAVILEIKGEEARILYADETRMWLPLRSLEKANTWAQPEVATSGDVPVTPAEVVEGWMHPNNSPLAHWGDGSKVLCGREVPAGTEVKPGRDPRNAHGPVCLKCRASLDRRPVAAAPEVAMSVEGDTPFPVSEADIDLAAAKAKAVVKPRKKRALEEEQTPEAAPRIDVAAPAFPIPHFEPPRLGLQELPLSVIRASALNPRKRFDEAPLHELAISIYKEGLQQNLVVRPDPERHGLFEIAAGERRWRAMSLLATTGVNAGTEDQPDWLSWEKNHPVPVLVRELTDLALLEVATAENVQRRGFTRLEEADAFAALLDLGATVDSLHEHSGLGKRTILRRVQISRNLIPELREMYESEKLSLQQVEVLALGTAGAQEALLKNQLKYGAHTTPEQLRMLIQERVFETSRTQFPRSWYTGKVMAVDLFGEMPEHFADFDLAYGCQARHAVELARKDVSKGAAFSDVREQANGVNFQYAEAYAGQGGTVYWVNTQSGELRRYGGKTRLSNASAPTYQFEETRVVPTHETPERTSASTSGPAASTSPATSAAAVVPEPATSAGGEGSRPAAAAPVPVAPVARYPSSGTVANEAFKRLTLQSVSDVRVRQALYVLEALSEDYGVTMPASVEGAVKTLAEGSGGALILTEDGDLSLPEFDHRRAQERALVAALRALLEAPAEALDLVFGAYLTAELRDRLSGVLEGAVAEVAGFELSEVYLGNCNHEALLEMWQSAGLPEETNAADEYLRAMLLEAWPHLKARGWLPVPLVATAAD